MKVLVIIGEWPEEVNAEDGDHMFIYCTKGKPDNIVTAIEMWGEMKEYIYNSPLFDDPRNRNIIFNKDYPIAKEYIMDQLGDGWREEWVF